MKYIVVQFKLGDQKFEYPFIFPNAVVHKEMETFAECAIRRSVGAKNLRPSEMKVVGAGELSCMNISAECHGNSETCGVASREGVDGQLIGLIDYTHGVIF